LPIEASYQVADANINRDFHTINMASKKKPHQGFILSGAAPLKEVFRGYLYKSIRKDPQTQCKSPKYKKLQPFFSPY